MVPQMDLKIVLVIIWTPVVMERAENSFQRTLGSANHLDPCSNGTHRKLLSKDTRLRRKMFHVCGGGSFISGTQVGAPKDAAGQIPSR